MLKGIAPGERVPNFLMYDTYHECYSLLLEKLMDLIVMLAQCVAD